MRSVRVALLGLALCFGTSGLAAKPMSLDVVLSPKDQIRLDFQGNSRHFLMFIEREGKAAGSGAFADAKVVEYGMHDVVRGESANAKGYLEVTTAEGDIANFKWQLRARFVSGPEGETRVINNGIWELTGGTGQFASMGGVGTMSLEFVNKTDRRYVFEGDISPAL